MPIPAIAIGAALAAGKVAGSIAAHKAAKQQAQANRRAALDALNVSEEAIAMRRMEEREAALQAIRNARMGALQATGSAQLAAAENNVAGVTVELMAQAIAMQSGGEVATLNANADMIDAQLVRQLQAERAQAQAQINSNPNPSGAALGLSIASSVLGLVGQLSLGGPSKPTMSPGAQASLWLARNKPQPLAKLPYPLPNIRLPNKRMP